MRYPEEVKEFIKNNYKGTSYATMAALLKEKFGIETTANKMRSYYKNHNFKSGVKKGFKEGEKNCNPTIFPDDIRTFIKENHQGVRYAEMAALIKEKFGREYKPNQIRNFYKNQKFRSGIDCKFKKGHIPPNKGKKMSPEEYEKYKHTFFQPGRTPHNKLPIGSVRYNACGYYRVKVADPNTWEWCHIKAWKDAYGEIPEGMTVTFKNSDRTNWDVSNLMLVSRAETAVINNMKLATSSAELKETSILVAKVVLKKNEIIRERKQNERITRSNA